MINLCAVSFDKWQLIQSLVNNHNGYTQFFKSEDQNIQVGERETLIARLEVEENERTVQSSKD